MQLLEFFNCCSFYYVYYSPSVMFFQLKVKNILHQTEMTTRYHESNENSKRDSLWLVLWINFVNDLSPVDTRFSFRSFTCPTCQFYQLDDGFRCFLLFFKISCPVSFHDRVHSWTVLLYFVSGIFPPRNVPPGKFPPKKILPLKVPPRKIPAEDNYPRLKFPLGKSPPSVCLTWLR